MSEWVWAGVSQVTGQDGALTFSSVPAAACASPNLFVSVGYTVTLPAAQAKNRELTFSLSFFIQFKSFLLHLRSVYQNLSVHLQMHPPRLSRLLLWSELLK